jgi:hypothetical protein
MAEKLDPKETISILELTVSHMWSIAGLVEVLEQKDILASAGSARRHHELTASHANGRAGESSVGGYPRTVWDE